MFFGEGKQINLTRDDVANIASNAHAECYQVVILRERFVARFVQGESTFTLVAPLGTMKQDMAELGIGMVN
jgi:hypothetical protein